MLHTPHEVTADQLRDESVPLKVLLKPPVVGTALAPSTVDGARAVRGFGYLMR